MWMGVRGEGDVVASSPGHGKGLDPVAASFTSSFEGSETMRSSAAVYGRAEEIFRPPPTQRLKPSFIQLPRRR